MPNNADAVAELNNRIAEIAQHVAFSRECGLYTTNLLNESVDWLLAEVRRLHRGLKMLNDYHYGNAADFMQEFGNLGEYEVRREVESALTGGE